MSSLVGVLHKVHRPQVGEPVLRVGPRHHLARLLENQAEDRLVLLVDVDAESVLECRDLEALFHPVVERHQHDRSVLRDLLLESVPLGVLLIGVAYAARAALQSHLFDLAVLVVNRWGLRSDPGPNVVEQLRA